MDGRLTGLLFLRFDWLPFHMSYPNSYWGPNFNFGFLNSLLLFGVYVIRLSV